MRSQVICAPSPEPATCFQVKGGNLVKLHGLRLRSCWLSTPTLYSLVKGKLVHTGGHSLIKATLLHHQQNADELKTPRLSCAFRFCHQDHQDKTLAHPHVFWKYLWFIPVAKHTALILANMYFITGPGCSSNGHKSFPSPENTNQCPNSMTPPVFFQYPRDAKGFKSRTGAALLLLDLRLINWLESTTLPLIYKCYLPFNRHVIIPLRVLVYQQNYGAPVQCLKRRLTRRALRYAFLCALMALLDLRVN